MTYKLEEADKPERDMMAKYRSRKWRLTLMLLLVAISFAGIDMLSDNLTQILLALGVSYNAAQGLVDWQNTKYHD